MKGTKELHRCARTFGACCLLLWSFSTGESLFRPAAQEPGRSRIFDSASEYASRLVESGSTAQVVSVPQRCPQTQANDRTHRRRRLWQKMLPATPPRVLVRSRSATDICRARDARQGFTRGKKSTTVSQPECHPVSISAYPYPLLRSCKGLASVGRLAK